MTGTTEGTLRADSSFQMSGICAAEPQTGGVRTNKLALAGAATQSQTGCMQAETGTGMQIGNGMTMSIDITAHAITGTVSSSAVGIETGGEKAPGAITKAEAGLPVPATPADTIQICISEDGDWNLSARLRVQSLRSMQLRQCLRQNRLQSLHGCPLHRHP